MTFGRLLVSALFGLQIGARRQVGIRTLFLPAGRFSALRSRHKPFSYVSSHHFANGIL